MSLTLRPRLLTAHPARIDPDRLARHNARYALRVLNADAVIARARRAALRALPSAASLPCGCGLDTLCRAAALVYLAGDECAFSEHRLPLFGRPARLRVTRTGKRIAQEAL